jgi:two-component system chemotaxis response regulator CheY
MRGLVQIVEDDQDDRLLLRELLRRECFEVWEAIHGADALRQLLAGNVLPSLILLDVCMPVISGTEFLEALDRHARFSRIPVIMLTGLQMEAPPRVRGFLRKPFKDVDLMRLIHEARVPAPPVLKYRKEPLDAG